MAMLILSLGVLAFCGVVPLLLPQSWRLPVFSALVVAGLGLMGTVAVSALVTGHTVSAVFSLPEPLNRVVLEFDDLSAFFAAVICLGGIAGTLFGSGYLKPYSASGRSLRGHLCFYGVFILSMLLVVMAREALTFLLAWELMSLSSLVLVAFDRDKDETAQAAINYLIWMHVAFALLLVGFVLLMTRAGGGSFSEMSQALSSDSAFAEIALGLVFAGFAIKAGFIPFHSWLPIAHPAAPSHVSGLMSGVMIKTGIYGIMRFTLLGGVPSLRLAYIVLGVAVVSSVVGVIYALAQHDLKRLLAYHSVENIGIIGIGLGLGMLGMSTGSSGLVVLGFSGALMHVLNHAVFKGLLFYGAGAVYQATHTRDIERLGGLAKKMPATATLFLIGSVAITGLPPLNGFASEFVLYLAMTRGVTSGPGLNAMALVLSIGGLALTGALALFCFTKAFGIVFLGAPRTNDVAQATEASPAMLAGMGILGALTVVIGMLSAIFFGTASQVSAAFFGAEAAPEATQVISLLWQISLVMAIGIGLFTALLLLRGLLLRRHGVARGKKTWDCGYQHGNVRMQYTASSFASPFLTIIAKPLLLKQHLIKPQGLFPTVASFESHCRDAVDAVVVAPLSRGIRYLFSLFRWVQSGDLAQYILYGVLFLIAALVWTMGGRG